MGLYAKYVLPKMVDKLCGDKGLAEIRATWVPQARGHVLELGFGSGHNLAHLEASSLTAVEPARELVELARTRIGRAEIDVEVIEGSAEELPFEANTFDSVLATWTLCSIPNVYGALREARRVLKPGGTFVFAEHGASPEPEVARWQRRVEPLWKLLAGGCHLTRDPTLLLADAGFRLSSVETDYLPGPKFATYSYRGVAKPR